MIFLSLAALYAIIVWSVSHPQNAFSVYLSLAILDKRGTAVKEFCKSILGGVCIAFGGTVYLSVDNHIAGAFLFSVGLLSIFLFDLNLFTGKVCDLPHQPLSYWAKAGFVFAGNLVGAIGIGLLERYTKLSRLIPTAQTIAEGKLADNLFSAFVMGIFCGFMICIAVVGYRRLPGSGKYLAVIFGVMVFTLSGFEHVIANLYYYSIAGTWQLKSVLNIFVVGLGNLVGGAAIPFLLRLCGQKDNTEQA